MGKYTLGTGWSLADQVDDAGKAAFIQSVKLTDSTGAAVSFPAGVAQGSTTSGQTGLLTQGAVTTAAPAYTTAQTSPLSLTTGGDLRTVFSNASLAVTQATASSLKAQVSGPDADRATSTAVANQIAGYYLAGGAITGRTTGQVAYLMTDAFGNLRVNPSYLASSSVNRAATFGIAQANSQGAQSDVVLATANWLYNGASLDAGRKVNLYSRFASSAASGAPTSAKATAGDVMGFFGLNTQASVRYLHIYNKSSAPTLGTDTPVMSFPIAASAAFSFTIPNGGAYFNTGIAYAFTTDIVTIPTTGAAAADITAFTMLMA